MPTATTSPPPPSAPEPPSHSPPLASHSPPFPFDSPPLPSPTPPQIHTYHHICLTHILTTPYALPSLPTRAAPGLDNARILPLPPLSTPPLAPSPSPSPSPLPASSKPEQLEQQQEKYLPSLLHNLRPARKALVIQREDGWERRRVWRCGRCGVGVGYEIEGTDAVDGDGRGKDKRGGEGKGERERERERETGEKLRVMYLLEEGLVETGEMMAAGGG